MGDDRIDIEQLMTRLDSQMPYDAEVGASDELSLLLSDVKRAFITTIEEARKGDVQSDALQSFAKVSIELNATLVTFNYDDILDAELYASDSAHRWSPDAGYGFRCEPSLSSVRGGGYDTGYYTAQAPLLLKLHGSMNWRTRRGYAPPYALDAIVHHEDWSTQMTFNEEHYVSFHIAPDQFIVPPILAKSGVSAQPVLRLVWWLAFRALSEARRVVFVGYSMPATDIAAKFLFRESIRDPRQIRIVNLAQDSSESSELERAYRRVFPDLKSEQFDYRGAMSWAMRPG
ncbi:MAG: hypothetical protein M3P30_01155 [Chloroflexota bacterium]|nr:hypothetical protein [Chloroflexota bacterium]